MTFDQAQSPRLGQRVAPEQPGIRLVTSTTLPEAPWAGQVIYVLDTSTMAVYDGSIWRAITGGGGGGGGEATVTVGLLAPEFPVTGALWFNPQVAVLSVFDGIVWQETQDLGTLVALNLANQALTVAKAAVNHYVQGVAPWDNGDTEHEDHVGDIWTNTNAGNARYWWTSDLIWAPLLLGEAGIATAVMSRISSLEARVTALEG